MKEPSGHQPPDFEPYPCVDEVIQIAVGVLQGQGVGVHELLADEDVDFRGQIHEVGSGWSDGRGHVAHRRVRVRMRRGFAGRGGEVGTKESGHVGIADEEQVDVMDT